MLALLADIGSTFTKMTAVDLCRSTLLATAQAPTTVEDIQLGLDEALRRLKVACKPEEMSASCRLACSSAAGGLRMVTVGLVPELTVEAARRAALGAGAKVTAIFSHQLTGDDLTAIEDLHPDILLLTGGTDGGNAEVVLHNARALGHSRARPPVVVACNRVVAQEVAATLRSAGLEVWVAPNVMPDIGQLNVCPAQEAIREIFLQRIVQAKGLQRAERSFSGVLMPTPTAVLNAARLLAQGTDKESGWSDILVVDVGGATTDVHSVASGRPNTPGAVLRGLPEPWAKRTVEGDMGIRYNALTILEEVDSTQFSQAVGWERPELDQRIMRIGEDVDLLPTDERTAQIDVALARAATEIAVKRHAGALQVVYTPAGQMTIQRGKDLTQVDHVIGTGGVFAHCAEPARILQAALFSAEDPTSLRPKGPTLWIDSDYTMAAMGLLAERQPTTALRILKRHLREVT